jgi:hypothetical protein
LRGHGAQLFVRRAVAMTFLHRTDNASLLWDVIRSDPFRVVADGSLGLARAWQIPPKREYMAKTTTTQNRESHKKLKPKPKTESKSWQTRNAARKDKQAAHGEANTAKTNAVE